LHAKQKKRKENHYERSSEFLWQINNKPRNFSSPSLYMPHRFSFYFLLFTQQWLHESGTPRYLPLPAM